MARLTPLPHHQREEASTRGVRVVIDVRPIQEPERSPLTAHYLDRLLTAFANEPLAGESFVLISRTLRDDPTLDLEADGLAVAGRRRLPPTARLFRSAGLTLDSFLLRGAELGTSAGDASGGGSGTVFHTAGGAVPLASGLPIVATLLDLAPWDLPNIYAASAAARLGHRLRARVLHDATRIIVCSRATAESARRRLRLPADRLVVIPLAVDEAFRAAGRDPARIAEVREQFDLPPRFVVFAGRYDARKDMRTLFEALRLIREPGRTSRATGNGGSASLPALVFAVSGRGTEDARLIEQATERHNVQDLVRIVELDGPEQRAAMVAAAEAFIYPALSEATALPALEALSLGVPVISSRAGALPETVGSAGIIVEPRDPQRLAAAIEAMWATGSLAEQLRRQARRRADGWTRTWSDVARETREVYSDAARMVRR
jgi:alpha-1,3-rhamnosyl/mannosyltransferase